MAKRKFELTDEAQAAFEQAERETRDAYELKRLQAVRLYGSGIATTQITRLVQAGERRIREWTHKYEQQGLVGLKSAWQGENALKLSREQRADLKQRLHQYRPEQVMGREARISRGQFWTINDLPMVVEAWDGVGSLTPESYHPPVDECG